MRAWTFRALWAVDEVVVVTFVFVLMFGAVRPGEILPVTLAIAGLMALWVWHALARRA